MNFSINYTRRDELSDIISDCYKELNGVRPRHFDFRNLPIEELESIAEEISSDLNGECIRKEKEHKEAVNLIMGCGAIDVETAERWLDEAEYSEYFDIQ